MKYSLLAVMAFMVLACGVSSDTGINKSIFVSDGEHRTNGLRTVNGSITVGNKVVVDGDCSTVNGKITIGENSQVGEVSCVNGSIHLDRNSNVAEVSCVNGSIHLGSEVQVAGDVSTVNGSIKSNIFARIVGDMETVNGDMIAEQTTIGGNIQTVNGDIDLLNESVVKGNIIVDRHSQKRPWKEYKELVITVDSGSKINGYIEVKGDEPNVTVVLSGGGEVLGDIINARVVRK
ncbi:MAG: hypothetical protein L3J79_00275 [Candidatus Marinimicrobia bacterium]|nr:hypothetical protein [Candidatus Neomarinimicrobiota bacterium]